MTSDINYKLPKEKKAFRLTEESKEKAWSVNFSMQMNTYFNLCNWTQDDPIDNEDGWVWIWFVCTKC